MISPGSQHVRPVGRTYGEPNEIELTPIAVKLNGGIGDLCGGVHCLEGEIDEQRLREWVRLDDVDGTPSQRRG